MNIDRDNQIEQASEFAKFNAADKKAEFAAAIENITDSQIETIVVEQKLETTFSDNLTAASKKAVQWGAVAAIAVSGASEAGIVYSQDNEPLPTQTPLVVASNNEQMTNPERAEIITQSMVDSIQIIDYSLRPEDRSIGDNLDEQTRSELANIFNTTVEQSNIQELFVEDNLSLLNNENGNFVFRINNDTENEDFSWQRGDLVTVKRGINEETGQGETLVATHSAAEIAEAAGVNPEFAQFVDRGGALVITDGLNRAEFDYGQFSLDVRNGVSREEALSNALGEFDPSTVNLETSYWYEDPSFDISREYAESTRLRASGGVLPLNAIIRHDREDLPLETTEMSMITLEESPRLEYRELQTPNGETLYMDLNVMPGIVQSSGGRLAVANMIIGLPEQPMGATIYPDNTKAPSGVTQTYWEGVDSFFNEAYEVHSNRQHVFILLLPANGDLESYYNWGNAVEERRPEVANLILSQQAIVNTYGEDCSQNLDSLIAGNIANQSQPLTLCYAVDVGINSDGYPELASTK